MKARVIINAEPDNFILAVRAAKSMIDNGYQHCGFDYGGLYLFSGTRNKSSITIWEQPRTPTNPVTGGV